MSIMFEESKNQLVTAVGLQNDILNFNFKEPIDFKFGIKSPLYSDFRMTLAYPKLRTMIKEGFAYFYLTIASELTEAKKANGIIIAGIQTGGTPHAAILSDRLSLPLAYVRPGTSAKEYGLKKQVEGASVKGKVVILIEDLISTGESAIENAKIILSKGAVEVKILCIFTYGFKRAAENFIKAKLTYKALLTATDLLPFLKEKLLPNEYDLFCKWVDNPEEWFEKHFQSKTA